MTFTIYDGRLAQDTKRLGANNLLPKNIRSKALDSRFFY